MSTSLPTDIGAAPTGRGLELDAPRVPASLSVVVPVYNEEGAAPLLAREIHDAVAPIGLPFEILFVDDASTDQTVAKLHELAMDQLVVLQHTVNCGQSSAVATGFRFARGDAIATLDGDGQNDPADIARLLELLPRFDAVCGVRAKRRDNALRRFSSKVANGFRNLVTGDRVLDAGCAMRVMRRDVLREVLVFNGMHRFLPTLLRLQGFRIRECEVGHRPRTTGTSKYGVWNRAWRGVVDCFAIRWYRKRVVRGERISVEQAASQRALQPLPEQPR